MIVVVDQLNCNEFLKIIIKTRIAIINNQLTQSPYHSEALHSVCIETQNKTRMHVICMRAYNILLVNV